MLARKLHSNPKDNFFMHELARLPAERGLEYRGNTAWIRCPHPEHSGGMERTPSCKINLDTGKYQGSYFCFGCKRKGGWNKLADILKLQRISDSGKSAHMSFSFKKFDNAVELPDFDNMIPWNINRDWRGIRGETLVRFNTKVYEFNTRFGARINLLFPVAIQDEYVGYIRAIMHKPKIINGKKQLTYFNMDGEWSSHSLFGYDIAAKKSRRKPLWLVEGPRDTMNVEQHDDSKVVGLIGSYISARKISLIMELDPPVIIIATDNDDAGNNAADALMYGDNKRNIPGLGALIPCIRLNFKNGRDPADLTEAKVRHFNRKALGRA